MNTGTVNTDKIIQAFAVHCYTAAADIVQQVDPIFDDVDTHEARLNRVISDIAAWLSTITVSDLEQMRERNAHLEYARWMPLSDDYDATAVCAVIQDRILALFTAGKLDEAQTESIHELLAGTADYLADMTPHKAGWLAERAANLLVINL